MYKIEAIVMANGEEAYVLNEAPRITYERYGNYLFGLDEYGVFANSYKYDKPCKHWKAFAGREFEIPMSDGTTIKANGQWWDGGTGQFTETIGCEIVRVIARDIAALKKCYVFHGLRAVKDELVKLRNTYKGKVYEYWEYECCLTGNSFRWDRDPKNPQNMASMAMYF